MADQNQQWVDYFNQQATQNGYINKGGSVDPTANGTYGSLTSGAHMLGPNEMPIPGESYDQWLNRVSEQGFLGIHTGGGGFSREQLMRMITPETFAKMNATPEQQKAQQEADASKQRESGIRSQLDDFTRWANRPLDQILAEPDTRRLLQSAQATTENNDRLRGVQGGLSNINSEKAFMDAGLAVQNQRKQMALSAMGTQLQDVNAVNQLREQARQFDVNQYNQNTQKQYDAQHGTWQTIGAVGGGVLGGVVGGLATAGNPMGVAAGASIGSSAGAGLAGSAYTGSHPYPSYSPSAPSGGLSGRNY